MNYHNLTYPDMNNGSGLRVVLWLSGCSHRCKGCQNPQTWDANSGVPFDESAKEELFRELDKDYISGLTLTGGDPLYESNLDGVLDLVTEVNKRYNTTQYIADDANENHNMSNINADKIRLSSPQKSIWIYSGYTWEDILDEDYNFLEMHDALRQAIIAQCNVFVDGQYKESQRDITIPYRGSKNQRVIDIQKSLQKGGVALWCN
ncbi:MAG: 4Fe-4S cluster-binding domain-containing protein [Lachnospiraceae bacterium]|nr:4Fe-4S cluster-binding domain-containing protein [Lachnospiraceae bacterium]